MYLDDQILLDRIAETDDQHAYHELFKRYYQALCGYAYKLTGSRATAEEIGSDVMLKVWTKRLELNIQASLKSYLFTAVRNRCIDHFRKKMREPQETEPVVRPDPADRYTPETDMVYQETHRLIEAAISRLPTKGQHIFRLSREEGLRYWEIAEQLNISVKTVETHIRRGLHVLVKDLKPYLQHS